MTSITNVRPSRLRRIFASYSRKDARAVHELVRLVRLTGAPVFLDIDSIACGERWAEKIADAIRAADLFTVFWSSNASRSEEVARELQLALSMCKPIVPVLIEDEALPESLADYQGVMLGRLFSPHDTSFDPTPHLQRLVDRFLL